MKHGSYSGRWRGADGRFVNKKIGKVRKRGEKDGTTRAEAERGLRRPVEAESRRPVEGITTVGVLLTPRPDGSRPWDTTLAAILGDPEFTSEALDRLRETWPTAAAG